MTFAQAGVHKLHKTELSRSSTLRCNVRRMNPRASLGRVLVVGAGGRMGLEVARALHAEKRATHVTGSICEGSSDLREKAEEVTDEVICLQPDDDESVEKAVSAVQADCVISCITDGSRALTEAAARTGVQRYVLLSALGAGDSEHDVPMQVYYTMRKTLMALSLAEKHVRDSNLNWTIVRPGPTIDGPRTGGAIFSIERRCYGTISPPDIADAVIRAADSPLAVGQALSVVDRESILLTAPYVRPLEFWETRTFSEFDI